MHLKFKKNNVPAVAMIFNGVHYSQTVSDKAFAYTRQSNGDVMAFFLKAVREKHKGYGFPGDRNAEEKIQLIIQVLMMTRQKLLKAICVYESMRQL